MESITLTRGTGWCRFSITYRDILLAGLFALTAFVARLPFALRGEVLLHPDEAIVGMMAQDIAAGRNYPVYFYGQSYMGALEAYVVALFYGCGIEPVIGVRLGPACFFAIFVATQFLMLTRWFGRGAGALAAILFIASSPMFVQWSIAARGGYIEVFLWGTILWWLYSEWHVDDLAHYWHRQLIYGLVIGSGLWINPMMIIFVVPLFIHFLLDRPLSLLLVNTSVSRHLATWNGYVRGWPVLLPACIVMSMIAASCIFSVHITPDGVHYYGLFALVSPTICLALTTALVLSGLGFLLLRPRPTTSGSPLVWKPFLPLLCGLLLGQLPKGAYLWERWVLGLSSEGSLPLVWRPVWAIGETLTFAGHSVPLLAGCDSRLLLASVLVGRDYAVNSLADEQTFILVLAHWLVLPTILGLVAGCVVRHRHSLADFCRLIPNNYPPAVIMMLAIGCVVVLYLFHGASFDFMSIRYLVLVWAILPGLIAALLAGAVRKKMVVVAITVVLLGNAVGQFAMAKQLGQRHPLVPLRDELCRLGVKFAFAEPYDAHVLSFLSEQELMIAEYKPFWRRLAHFQQQQRADEPAKYIVHAVDIDWCSRWPNPGPPTGEMQRRLWPELKKLATEHPEQIIRRETLVGGFELWTLRQPLQDDFFSAFAGS